MVCLFRHRYIFKDWKSAHLLNLFMKYYLIMNLFLQLIDVYYDFPGNVFICILCIYSFGLPDLFLLWDSSTPLQHALPACWTTRMIQGVSLNRSHNECDNRGLHYIIRFCFFEKRILQLHLIRQDTYFIYGLIHGRRTHGVLLQPSMTMICTKQL